MSQHTDVIIIGAGASGLQAAYELALTGKKVVVLEGMDTAGGRIRTIRDEKYSGPIEMGAEFVHGDLELTKRWLEKAGCHTYKVSGSIWQKRNNQLEEQKDFIEDYKAIDRKFDEPEKDITVDRFLKKYLTGKEFEEARFTLRNYVEGYYAGDVSRASTFALRDELRNEDEDQYRIEEGYGAMIRHLQNECATRGVVFHFNTVVQSVSWQKNQVIVQSGQDQFEGRRLLVTVPIGVLQAGMIAFQPELTKIREAVSALGFGAVVKTILVFSEPFWKSLEEQSFRDAGFFFSDAPVPTWWTHYPKDETVLTGWAGGPHADKLSHLTDKEIRQKALQSLSYIFNLSEKALESRLLSFHVANWSNHPFCLGGYSFDVVEGNQAKQLIKQPVDQTIYFAGEGLYEGAAIGTVEAALFTGREMGHRMIADWAD